MKIFREVKGIPEPEEDGKAAEAGKEGGDEAVRAQMKPAETKESRRRMLGQPERKREQPGSRRQKKKINGGGACGNLFPGLLL